MIRYIFLILLVVLCIDCDSKAKDIKYIAFYEVETEGNSYSGELKLKKKNRDKLSSNEIKALEVVLKELDWGYKLTTDSSVLIYSHYLNTIDEMYALNSLWQSEMQKTKSHIVPTKQIKATK